MCCGNIRQKLKCCRLGHLQKKWTKIGILDWHFCCSLFMLNIGKIMLFRLQIQALKKKNNCRIHLVHIPTDIFSQYHRTIYEIIPLFSIKPLFHNFPEDLPLGLLLHILQVFLFKHYCCSFLSESFVILHPISAMWPPSLNLPMAFPLHTAYMHCKLPSSLPASQSSNTVEARSFTWDSG